MIYATPDLFLIRELSLSFLEGDKKLSLFHQQGTEDLLSVTPAQFEQLCQIDSFRTLMHSQC